jgi:hypothetical protein
MTERDALTITSREQLRREIEYQTQHFLRSGGRIEVLHSPSAQSPRPIGPVWWDSRGSGPVALIG